MTRPDWNEYFMQMVEIVKTRSTCTRRQVGALIVKDNRVLASGYNGAPTNCRHCDSAGCIRAELNVPSGQRHELCRGLHAEQNAIIQSAKNGINIDNSIIYCTTQPCVICAKMIINAGIKKIIFNGEYPDKLSTELLKEANVELVKYQPPI